MEIICVNLWEPRIIGQFLFFFHLLWCVNATAIDRTIPYFLHTANIQNSIECDNQHRTKHNARLQHLKMIETINFTRTVEVVNAKKTVYAYIFAESLTSVQTTAWIPPNIV